MVSVDPCSADLVAGIVSKRMAALALNFVCVIEWFVWFLASHIVHDWCYFLQGDARESVVIERVDHFRDCESWRDGVTRVVEDMDVQLGIEAACCAKVFALHSLM